jgi:hypothetical protein
MKIKTTAYIYFTKYTWQDKGIYQVFSYKYEDDENRTFVCEQVIEIEVPEDYDPTAQQIAALESQKVKVMSESYDTVKEINDRISKLQALEYTA